VKRALAFVVVALLCAVAAAPAGATNECKGLMVCVPVAGPWVVATPEQSEFQLSCPKNYIVAGLDAELAARGLEVGFVGGLGSPVNPGITTQREALFLGRRLRPGGVPVYRPHIGCIPASGGGRRVPTAYAAFPPGKPTARTVLQIKVHAGQTKRSAKCPARQTLVSASHAVAFAGAVPPTAALVSSVTASHTVRSDGVVIVTVHAKQAGAIVQLDLLCRAA
jgi:hypothetical protein